MSIKFKQNGQWIKIPTPSQIDDTTESLATTYSSKKINEVSLETVKNYINEHKSEFGTDDFTKLKNIPFTLISANDSRFDTNENILKDGDGEVPNVADGTYMFSEDRNITINGCLDVYLYSGREYLESVCPLQIKKGSILVKTGVQFSIFGATIQDVDSENSSGYEYDYTKCITIMSFPFDHIPGIPDDGGYLILGITQMDMYNNLYTFGMYSWWAIGSSETAVLEDGSVLTYVGTDDLSPKFEPRKLPVINSTNINDDNYTSYNTLSKLASLDYGTYLVNTDSLSITTSGSNGFYNSALALFAELAGVKEQYSNRIYPQKGSYIYIYQSVDQDTSNKSKIIYIQTPKAVSEYLRNYRRSTGEPIIVVAGVGSNDLTVYDFGDIDTLNMMASQYSALALSKSVEAALNSETSNWNGKVAKWEEDSNGILQLTYTDNAGSKSVIPVTEIDNTNFSNYDTLQKWMNLDEGVYWFGDIGDESTTQQHSPYKVSKKIGILGTITTQDGETPIENASIRPCSYSYVVVSRANESGSATGTAKRVYFDRVGDNDAGAGVLSAGGPLSFSWDSRDIFNASNVTITDPTAAYLYSSYGIQGVMALSQLFGNIDGENDSGKFLKLQSSEESILGVTFAAESLLPTVNEVNDANKSNYDTTAKWLALDDGVYYVTAKNLVVTCNATDVIGIGEFSDKLVNIDPNSFVMVYTSIGSNGSTYNVKNVEFYSTHYTGGEGQLEFTFTQTAGVTPSKDNTTVAQFDTYAQSAMSMINGLNDSLGTMFGDISAVDDGKYLKVVKNGSDYKLEAADIMETVEIPAESTEVQLTNNTESRWLGNHNAVSLKLPTADSRLTTYKSRVVFVTSSTSPISLTLPDGVKWRGDDVTSGSFDIKTGTQYTIDFWNDGFSIKANVMAWK